MQNRYIGRGTRCLLLKHKLPFLLVGFQQERVHSPCSALSLRTPAKSSRRFCKVGEIPNLQSSRKLEFATAENYERCETSSSSTTGCD